ncbi:prepilin-type N-terminal cleavage/methylation domain-containing protein [Bacillus sp. 7884-1]|uniref:prepilin-type N-terminal cleavage/methylation domain-containing protein n=1 Tax=Bacillus sp. 7884-1 TaxID=2021693 RepID=UPI000BA58A57|nr:prepilin-type N-terminal cleavage/methylation domain-containing protein [Bacillus sp. 7884-1]PAE42190.1 hypothetical protein CHI06_12070 [Bacillus sp. 7884-1]
MLKKLGAKLKEQKGFTLIELLAVIVILGIIAAIAIPAISSVISKSETKSKAQEGLQIISAAKMFMANESDDKKVDAGLVEANGFAGDLTEADLTAYLDRTDDKDFTITVSVNTTNGGFDYNLTSHDSSKLKLADGTTDENGKTEQELIEIAK